jgi:hypothetical protein
MNLINIICIIVVIIIILCLIYRFNETEYVTSDSGNIYLLKTIEDKKTSKQSANALDQINTSNVILIDYLLKNYQDTLWITKLNENYKRNGSGLSEAAISAGLTSFTIDKTDMNICLRTRDNEDILYDYNTLMYVDLHELSHMGNYDINGYPIEGHGIEFIQKFKFILKTAIKLGLYNWVNYNINPKEYCGIVITSQILSNIDLTSDIMLPM